MTPKEKRNERLAAKLIANLERRHFEAYYCHTADEIINKVKGVNRVCYDISSKPPSTIEWE